MSQDDDLRGLTKVVEFMRAVSVLFVVIHVYWFCYETMHGWGLTIGAVDRVLLGFQRTAGLFDGMLRTKLFAVLFLGLSCLGTRGVKNDRITWERIWICLGSGAALFFLNRWILSLPVVAEGSGGSNIVVGADIANGGALSGGSHTFTVLTTTSRAVLYILTLASGYILMLVGGLWMSRLLKHKLMTDVFNTENESFMQETRLMTDEYSVNLPTQFRYKGRMWRGWINVVNPFRAVIVLGTPGSGKSYAVVNNFIKQQIAKGFAVYIYDYKFPDLSVIAYNTLLKNLDKYNVKPRFYVINFDDPRRSHRCNPIAPEFMTDISDAYESAYTIMLNLNRTWIQKQGDFFVESPIILLAAIIWYLKIYNNGKYCTFPHAIEFLNKPYVDIFPILTSYPALENYLSPFMDAWRGGAQDQLQGQIASAKIPLSRMISPQLYWVMTGSDFTLDINNPSEPKILCVGNNPDRQNIYGAALGLYNSRIVKLINKKGQLKSSVIIDELPTIYFRGLDNLIATARSNKVAVCLGFQDFSQLNRDYGDKESKVIQNTVGNIFSGQVVGETARALSERFGKILQQRQSVSINRSDTSTSINTQLDSLIPASKIANLSQGIFVGLVADNFGQEIDQKIFHAKIIVDNQAVEREVRAYRPIPVINDFGEGDGNYDGDGQDNGTGTDSSNDSGHDVMTQQIQRNYGQIKADVLNIVASELKRMKADSVLRKLLPGCGEEETDDGSSGKDYGT